MKRFRVWGLGLRNLVVHGLELSFLGFRGSILRVEGLRLRDSGVQG